MARKKKKDEAGFEQAPAGGRRRLTPVDVQEKVFRLAFRGYSEQEVDEFLDQVTEDLAVLHEENKRLREKVEQGGAGSSVLPDAQRRADEIVRQAREQAARLLADAERRGGAGSGEGAAAAPASFLVRERDFLHQMASLIQGHAEALKQEARRAKEAEAAAPPPPTAAAAAAGIAAAPAPVPPPMQEPPPAAAPAEPPAASSVDEPTQSHSPLLDEWEGGVSGGPEDQPYEGSDLFGDPAPPAEGEDDQASLRELFWGEE
ncbi:MAG TPA: DivIVA domain-containing protein [Actinomycetota bacterium]|nr:DivIVA domain-containing protein [Actinomycetota bacterium]